METGDELAEVTGVAREGERNRKKDTISHLSM